MHQYTHTVEVEKYTYTVENGFSQPAGFTAGYPVLKLVRV
jgi:hypothetical protein